MGEATTLDVRRVPLLAIRIGPHQVRGPEEDPELVDLAEDIRRNGLINALTVRETPEGLVVVAGHRRYQACRMAGVTEVEVHVVQVTDAQAAGIVFAENFHRKDVSPIEQGAQIRDVLLLGEMDEQKVASTVGRSVRWVREQLELLDWPEDIQFALHRRRISVSAAGYLKDITDASYRQYLLDLAVDGGASARTCMAWLAAWQSNVSMAEASQIVAEPGGAPRLVPAAQAPCLMCGELHPPDGMCTILMCPGCVSRIREAQRQ